MFVLSKQSGGALWRWLPSASPAAPARLSEEVRVIEHVIQATHRETRLFKVRALGDLSIFGVGDTGGALSLLVYPLVYQATGCYICC